MGVVKDMLKSLRKMICGDPNLPPPQKIISICFLYENNSLVIFITQLMGVKN